MSNTNINIGDINPTDLSVLKQFNQAALNYIRYHSDTNGRTDSHVFYINMGDLTDSALSSLITGITERRDIERMLEDTIEELTDSEASVDSDLFG